MEKITVERPDSVNRKITIQVPREDLKVLFDQFYSDLNDKVVLKGFRRGLIPRSVMETQFGAHAKSAVSQDLLSKLYQKALQDNAIIPIANPTVLEYDKDLKIAGRFDENGFEVNILIEVMPAVDVNSYQGMSLLFPPAADIPALVAGKLQELRFKFAERKPITDRPAQMGDMVVLDYAGTLDGVPVPGLAETGYTVNSLGTGGSVEGFDQNIVGMTVGSEKDFELAFPANYAGGLGGKTAKMHVKLNNVIEVKLAEVNQDLALMTGFSTVDELNAAIESEAKATTDRINRGNLELQIISKLAKANSVEVPESMVKQESTRIVEELKAAGREVTDAMAQNIESAARYNIARYILVEAIYNKEPSLEITPDELDIFLEKGAKENKKGKDEFVSDLYNANKMEVFLNILKCDKVLDFVISKAVNESEAV
jgi:trigger factor